MFTFVLSLFGWFNAFVRSRNSLGLEIVVLRYQVSVLKRKNARPRFGPLGSSAPDFSAPGLVPVGDGVGDREAGDRRTMAWGRISALLVFPFQAQGEGQAQDWLRASSTHRAHGEGESDLGNTADT
jgi:hypothetical protein